MCACFLFPYVCFILFPIPAEGNSIWQGGHIFKVTAFKKRRTMIWPVYSIMNVYYEIIAQNLCYKKGWVFFPLLFCHAVADRVVLYISRYF